MIIDCHAHLNLRQFEGIRDQVIKRAQESGVCWIIENGLEKTSNLQALALSNEFPIVRPAFGLYPHNLQQRNLEDEFEILEKHSRSYVALGEVGLDGTEPDMHLQKEVFGKIIDFGKRLQKPLIVHSRKAESEVLRMLKEEKAADVILHAFHGSLGLAKEAAKAGYFLSVPCNVVRSMQMQSMVEALPMSSLVTETDSPYLGPFSREEKNEPKNLPLAIRKIAEIKKISEITASDILFDNARRIFGL